MEIPKAIGPFELRRKIGHGTYGDVFEGFDPERFSEERAEGRSQFAYIPFGAGHRYCIGGPLALVQMKLITAVIAQRFVLDVKPGHPVEPIPGTVMRPEQGMPMLIQHLRNDGRSAFIEALGYSAIVERNHRTINSELSGMYRRRLTAERPWVVVAAQPSVHSGSQSQSSSPNPRSRRRTPPTVE